MVHAPFIDVRLDRTLPDDYAGDLYLWDIDKTYLQTHFSSLKGLLAIPMEFAVDKKAVPGAAALLRALRRGPGDLPDVNPLFFVSGSPPQLRSVIERKMNLDGVQFDGIAFKDQWGLVKDGRPKAIKEQVGYKLAALLMVRARTTQKTRWHLFGDDVESDAEVFALFGKVCAGLGGSELKDVLDAHRVHEKEQKVIFALLDEQADSLGGDDPVDNIFIHLDRKTPPEKFTDPKVVPCHGYLQAALVLAQQGKVATDAIYAVANDSRRNRFTEDHMAFLLDDARTRLHVDEAWLQYARR